MSDTTVKCPDCNGKGFYHDQYLWSDGWGTVEMRCGLCDGTGNVDLVNELRALKKKAAADAGDLRDLKDDVLRYVDSLDGREYVRGLHGSSTNAPEFWLDRLRKVADSTARVHEAYARKTVTEEHDNFHVPTGKYYRELPNHACAARGSRNYCLKCHPNGVPNLTTKEKKAAEKAAKKVAAKASK